MTNKKYNVSLEAPSTADKVVSEKFQIDNDLGNMFRIEKAFVAFPEQDAEATGDQIGFQITTKSNNGAAALLEITDKNAVFTWLKEYNVLGTNGPQVLNYAASKMIPIEGIEGTLLEAGKDYYWNSICTGQDAADVTTELVIIGHGVSTDIKDWHDNNF